MDREKALNVVGTVDYDEESIEWKTPSREELEAIPDNASDELDRLYISNDVNSNVFDGSDGHAPEGTTITASSDELDTILFQYSSYASLTFKRMSNQGFNWLGDWKLANAVSNPVDCVPTYIAVQIEMGMLDFNWDWPNDAPNGACAAAQLNGTFQAH